MANKYRKSSLMDDTKEQKYIGSFEITVPVEGRMLRAQIRPSTDGSYYSVILNDTFLAHIMKGADYWKDLNGKTSEIIVIVGNMIEEKLKG